MEKIKRLGGGGFDEEWKVDCTLRLYTAQYALQGHNTENSKQIFPEKDLRGNSPYSNVHVSVSDLYIPLIGLPFLLQENRCRPRNFFFWEYINLNFFAACNTHKRRAQIFKFLRRPGVESIPGLLKSLQIRAQIREYLSRYNVEETFTPL